MSHAKFRCNIQLYKIFKIMRSSLVFRTQCSNFVGVLCNDVTTIFVNFFVTSNITGRQLLLSTGNFQNRRAVVLGSCH